jgi:hypothetical protein
MAVWVETRSVAINMLRVVAVAGLVLTLLGCGFVFIYASLVEGGYEPDVRAEPWEWAVAAAILGAIAAAVAIYGLVVCSRAAVRVGAVTQGIAAAIVVIVALPNFDFWRSDYERNADFEREFIALAVLVLLFDIGVFFGSWSLPRQRGSGPRAEAMHTR